MRLEARYGIAFLLVLSVGLLAVMVPGGPVETRGFSVLPPVAVLTFNTFLTTLGVCSLVVAYWALRGQRAAFVEAALCGVLFALVYLLDLAGIFPVSADPMPPLLTVLETCGLLVAIPLVVLSLRRARAMDQGTSTRRFGSTRQVVFVLALVLLGAGGIIYFATKAALR
ncbi:conserved hypothetical protein [Solidesulfovibrio fructosivorans JJ]]|uniref:DUF8051 domain-containing protein n=1 Tax=Solidesulfovibrio fructosivorans JJ] TaxID=596151 RepID=E1JR61_SOLFR|nr:hypothetical protein [Solidesulfovibrio fructosivorans]EFL53062.1 conserved hypothetical protein [Solidesulfovibrio fructosivorans JJ]]